ncbi:glycosyl transferase [Spirochaetia bacterium]|nr:glycosyl transferase [Spirochaetia bacterium]
MKIVYILSSATKYGGANKLFYHMLTSLIRKGVKPFVLLPENGDMCEILFNDSIDFKVIPYYFTRYPPIRKGYELRDTLLYFLRLSKYIIVNFIAIEKIKKMLIKVNPDIIHSNVGPVHIGFHAARKLHIPHVWHLQEYQKLDFDICPFPSMKSFIKKLNSKNNYCIVITKGIYKYFQLSDSNTRIIYDGALNFNEKNFLSKKEKYFLFAGRLTHNKGVDNLINSFIEFSKLNKEYKLYIAGDTNDKKYNDNLYQIVEKNDLKERIVFLGMRDDIYELMEKATALVVPSLFEGFGLITVEAMFNGCLVIGNNTAGTKEILEPENLGLLYTTNDELVKTMLEVVNKGIESYYPMILKSQKKASELYSIEQNVDNVFNFYIEIVKAGHKK